MCSYFAWILSYGNFRALEELCGVKVPVIPIFHVKEQRGEGGVEVTLSGGRLESKAEGNLRLERVLGITLLWLQLPPGLSGSSNILSFVQGCTQEVAWEPHVSSIP